MADKLVHIGTGPGRRQTEWSEYLRRQRAGNAGRFECVRLVIGGTTRRKFGPVEFMQQIRRPCRQRGELDVVQPVRGVGGPMVVWPMSTGEEKVLSC